MRCPTASLDFKHLWALRTKFTLTLYRWNSKGGVLEVKTVETFWNGFANTFPSDAKYWFTILATERFSMCHFPFSKIEETVDFLVPGVPVLISQESPLASSIIWQKLFDLRFFFLMIGIIPQFSVHFPVVSTIGGACFSEVIIGILFHFSKFRCYPWVLLLLARLIFRGACSFAISENNCSHRKTASSTFSTPSTTHKGT